MVLSSIPEERAVFQRSALKQRFMDAGEYMEAIECQAGLVTPTEALLRSRVWMEKADLRSRLRKEGAFLFLSSAVIVISFLMNALKSKHLWVGIPCWFYKITHIPCLACGLTRSFSLTAHGRFSSAFEMHLTGPILFFLACGLTAYLAAVVVTGYRVRLKLAPVTRKSVGWTVFGIFVVCWVIKLVFMKGAW